MSDEALVESPFRLDADELEAMSKNGIVREYRPRTLVIAEGDQSRALYVILEGRVRVFVGGENGREMVLSLLGPGEYFGELSYDNGARSASVITLEPCRLLEVAHGEFADFIARNPGFANHFIQKLIGHVRALTQNVRSLALMDAYGRVARLLLESAVTKDGEQYVPGRITQAEIASRVGCSREMVSRILKDLVRGHYVTVEPERIVINRPPPARW